MKNNSSNIEQELLNAQLLAGFLRVAASNGNGRSGDDRLLAETRETIERLKAAAPAPPIEVEDEFPPPTEEEDDGLLWSPSSWSSLEGMEVEDARLAAILAWDRLFLAQERLATLTRAREQPIRIEMWEREVARRERIFHRQQRFFHAVQAEALTAAAAANSPAQGKLF